MGAKSLRMEDSWFNVVGRDWLNRGASGLASARPKRNP